MDDELVLLTSYFNLAGGRRQDTADTFRVEPNLSSATSADGAAALYVVTESSATGHMGPRARRRAADVVAWEYSSRGNEVPAQRLKNALQAAHDAVLSEFDGHVAVGTSVMAVEQDTVLLAQVAPAQVYVLHQGNLHSIPAKTRGRLPFSQALGSTRGPQISVFKDEFGPGDVVVLCPAWFHESPDPEELRDSFSGETADDIAESLLNLAKQDEMSDGTVIVVEAVLAKDLEENSTEEEPLTFMEQVDSAVQALAGVGRLLLTELKAQPSSNGRTHSAVIPELETSDSSEEALQEVAVEHVEATVALEPEAGSETHDVPPTPEPFREQATDEVPIVPAEPTLWEEPPPKAEAPVSEIEQVNQRIQTAPELGDVIPPVQAFPDTSTEPERIYATSKDIQAVNKRPRRFGGIGSGREPISGPTVIRPAMEDLDLNRPANRPAPPAVVWFGIAAVFVLAVGSIGVYIKNQGSAKVNHYPSFVRQDISVAKGSKKAVVQDVYLAKAQRNLSLAALNGTPPREIAKLRSQVQTTADTLHHVTRVSAPLLVTDFTQFPGTRPTEITTSSTSIFVLDKGRKSVFSINPATSSNPTLVAQAAEPVSGFQLGTPVHIATDGPILLSLDGNNVLTRDNQGTKTATSLPQGTSKENAVAMASSDPDVYVLDPANSQIWRYPGAVSFYSVTPQAFFSTSQPALSQAISFALDGSDIYVLRNAGNVLKYDFQGNAHAFHTNLATPVVKPTSIFTDQGLPYVWIADPANNRILQLDKSGAYIRTYRSSNKAMDFGAIKSIASGPKGKTLYALCGSKLFDFPVKP